MAHKTMKQYAEEVAEVAKKYPNAIVISSSDDEGNSFNPVFYSPTAGHYNEKTGEFDSDKKKVNAVCIN